MLDKNSIVKTLQQIAVLLKLKGDSLFQAQAYRDGARALAATNEDLDTLIKDQIRFLKIPGIGRGIAVQIKELYLTGRSSYLDRLVQELLPGIVELSQVPGLSLEEFELLSNELRIRTISDLKDACDQGEVRDVKGLNAKTEQKILEGIRRYESSGQEILLLDARRIGAEIIAYMQHCPDLARIDLAGSLRRWKETSSTIRVVASGQGSQLTVIEYFLRFPLIIRIDERTQDCCSVILADGVRAAISVVPLAEYWTALHHATGSVAYVEKMTNVADDKGFKLTAHALERTRPRSYMTLKSEEDIYRHLGMQYIPAELREDLGEIEEALSRTLPYDLVQAEDIQGMIHCHTVYSDGNNSIEEMALASEAMGMSYITITDHSPSVSYVRGVDLDQLKRQWDEIDEVQSRFKIKLLRGTESDILADGSLDYPDHVLEKFDVIIASIHSRMKMDEDQMTRRLVRAMKQPVFKIWGHALGRLLQHRPPFACRVEEVLDVIAESRAAVEINGDPHRLDMEPRWIREARKRGIRFVISVDAHSVAALKYVNFGVGIARRGWVRRSDVLNTLDTSQFQNAVRPA